MIFTKIIFTFKNKLHNIEEVYEKIDDFLVSLFQNGQIHPDYELIELPDALAAYVTLIDNDSLDEKYENEYVAKSKSSLTEFFSLDYEKIGKNHYADPICECKDSPFYVLYTHRNYYGSPIMCGGCGKCVPLYKLSKLGNSKNYFDELMWELCFKNIDELWLDSSVDRWSERQLINPNSALAKRGRNICNEHEKITGKPFYYFLFDADWNNKFDLPEKCPLCGKEWQKVAVGQVEWSLCEKCRLATKKYWND